MRILGLRTHCVGGGVLNVHIICKYNQIFNNTNNMITIPLTVNIHRHIARKKVPSQTSTKEPMMKVPKF